MRSPCRQQASIACITNREGRCLLLARGQEDPLRQAASPIPRRPLINDRRSTIGCALKARHWFLWVRCPACRTTQAVDLRTLDRHPWSAISSLIPALSCRSCRPHAPFAELVRLSDKSVADDLHEQHTRRALGG